MKQSDKNNEINPRNAFETKKQQQQKPVSGSERRGDNDRLINTW
jgi:hypothetical protein